MLEIKTTKQKRVHTISMFAALGVLATVLVVWAGTGITQRIISERQAELIKKLRSNVADSPSFLVERLFEMQERSISLFLPGMPNPVCCSSGLYSFDPATFPETFLKGMVYEVEYGSPVYHLRLREVRATREIEVLDADGKVFYVFQPDAGYDPLWLARRKHPEIFKEDGNPSQRAFMLECMEPSHVEMSISLIPVAYVDIYAEERITSLLDVMLAKDQLSVVSSKMSGMAMMRMAGSDTNIVVAQIAVGGTGVLLRVEYPDTLTNRLEVLVSTNLMDQHWWVVETNLVTTGTNTLEWLDVSLTNLAGVPPRFYQIGNSVDHDGDGLEDGREVIIYHTDPNSRDSDGDGLTDGAEVLSWGTNPNNPDSDGDLFPDGWETQNGYDPATAQTWNLADGKIIITSTYTQWNNTFHCNSIDYSCPFNAINNVITKQVKGVVWSDAITNVLLIVGGDKYGNRLRRYTAPVVNRQFTTDMPLLPGYNYIQAYAGYEVSNVCYYIGTDKFLMSLVVDAQPTNTLRMEFDSTIYPSITNRPLFDVIIQQGTYNGFSTPCSWAMQRNGLNDFPTASWVYYPWGTWDGSTRSINISPVSGMIRVDVHDVSQNRGTHSDTLRVLMNNEVISEEVRTGLSNFITNDYHRYDTAMKGGVWAYHNRSCGGFTVDGDKNITLLPQMAQVGYHYQPPLDGGPYGDSMFRESNGISGTTTTWPYEWYGMTNMVLTGPNGSSPVYLKYGESAQFSATGSVMLNTPGLWVTTNYPGLGIVNCFSGPDAYGVYNGYKPGHTNITCSGSSSTIEVFVAGSPASLKVDLRELSFTNNFTIISDNGETAYSSPQWQDPNGDGNISDGHAYPLCFQRNTKMILASGKWHVSQTNLLFSVKIRGDGPGIINFPETLGEINGSDITVSNIECTASFANEVDFKNPMVINWKFSVDNGGSWCSAGISSNKTYVTLGSPAITNVFLYQSLVDIGCRNAIGQTTADGVVDSIWTDFENRIVKRCDDQTMFYYSNSVPTNSSSDLKGLLSTKDGQCTAWAELFEGCLLMQGITDSELTVLSPGNVVRWDINGPTNLPITNVVFSLKYGGMLVNNWSFLAANWPTNDVNQNWIPDDIDVAYPAINNHWSISDPDIHPVYKNFIMPYEDSILPFSYQGETNVIASGTGIKGQGDIIPSVQMFGHHYVVTRGDPYQDPSTPPQPYIIYDPSYGKKYNEVDAVDHWASDSVAGYYELLDSNQTNSTLKAGVNAGNCMIQINLCPAANYQAIDY